MTTERGKGGEALPRELALGDPFAQENFPEVAG
jgi:hypothetical protein